MIKINDYLTDEQKGIITQIEALPYYHVDDAWADLTTSLDGEETVVNHEDNVDDLSKHKDIVCERGLAFFENKTKSYPRGYWKTQE